MRRLRWNHPPRGKDETRLCTVRGTQRAIRRAETPVHPGLLRAQDHNEKAREKS